MDKLDLCCLMSLSSAVTVLLLCVVFLVSGGFGLIWKESDGISSIQRMIVFSMGLSFVAFIPYIINYYFLPQPNWILENVSDIISIAAFAFIPLEALALRQIELKTKYYLGVFLPILPLLLSPLFVDGVSSPIFIILYILTYLYYATLLGFSFFRLSEWDRKMKDLYSDVCHKQTLWFRQLTVPFLFLPLFWIPMYFFEYKWIDIFYYFLLSVAFVRATVCAMQQEEFDPLADQDSEDETGTSKESELPVWTRNLDILMKEDCVYRKFRLTSTELAAMVGTNRTYLSKYLNEYMQLSFYDYINGFRLNESEKLLIEGNLDIKQIALQCGFNDHNTFYRNFIKRNGISPSEFQKRMKNTVADNAR